MLNKYEQQLYDKMIGDYSHDYLMEQLDIDENDALYASYYNPSPSSPRERYLILEEGRYWILVDVTIRNSFYGTILRSNCYDILADERERLISVQSTLFEVMDR